MSAFAIECPLCRSTEFGTLPEGRFECLMCSTTWGVGSGVPATTSAGVPVLSAGEAHGRRSVG